MDPRGFSGGLLIGWSDKVTVTQIMANVFYFELEFEDHCLHKLVWGIFVYANTNKKYRRAQLAYLM